jgi:DNA modification methylase
MSRSQQIRVEYVRVDKLKDWDRNPRIIPDHQMQALKKNIERFGIVDPIIVNRSNTIIGGHQRAAAAKQLGLKQVPIVRLNLKGKGLKVLNLALNRISGDWDNEKLAPILQELAALPEFNLTGFNQQEANIIIESFPLEEAANEDEIPEPPAKGQTHAGQLWKLGNHRLLCADSTDPHAWKKLMDDQRGHLAVIDPPYGVEYLYEHGKGYHLNKTTGLKKFVPKKSAAMVGDTSTDIAIKSLPLLFNNIIPNAAVYIFAGTELMIDVYNWLRDQRIHYGVSIVWDKGRDVVSWNHYHPGHENIIFCGQGSLPGGGNKRWFGEKNESTVWRIPIDDRGGKIHRAQKPVAIYERAIINSSAQGEIVVDNFGGSGSCLIAAEKHNRRAYLMEINPAYCDVIVKRWMTYTGRSTIVTN